MYHGGGGGEAEYVLSVLPITIFLSLFLTQYSQP